MGVASEIDQETYGGASSSIDTTTTIAVQPLQGRALFSNRLGLCTEPQILTFQEIMEPGAPTKELAEYGRSQGSPLGLPFHVLR